MKNRFFIYFPVFILLTCLCFKASAQNISAEAKLQQYTIRIGDQTKLFLSVHQPVKAHVTFPKLTDTVNGNVQLISTNKPDTTFDQNDHSLATITQSYTVTSFDAGTYTLPAFTITTTSGAIKTNELTLQVQTVKVDTTKSIYDIKRPIAVTYTAVDWVKDNWTWLVIAIIGILAVNGLIWYLLKRPKPAPVIVQHAAPQIPGHIIAINKLNNLRDKKLWQQNEFKEYHSELSDIIREYLETRYRVKTHEKTTEEILAALRYKNIASENWSKLKAILQLADLVKFAKMKPLPNENEETMDDAINFVLNTQQQNEPAVNTGGGNIDGSV